MRLASIALSMLMLVQWGQPPPGTTDPPILDSTPAALASDAPIATGRMSIWGEVPKQCTWHTEPLARVATDIQTAELPVDLQLENATEGWQLFSLTFDPARVSPEQVTQIMRDDGALIIPAPLAN